jgi:hypothetical protein
MRRTPTLTTLTFTRISPILHPNLTILLPHTTKTREWGINPYTTLQMGQPNLIHGPSTQAASLDRWAVRQRSELGRNIEEGRCIEIPFDDIKAWDKNKA